MVVGKTFYLVQRGAGLGSGGGGLRGVLGPSRGRGGALRVCESGGVGGVAVLVVVLRGEGGLLVVVVAW